LLKLLISSAKRDSNPPKHVWICSEHSPIALKIRRVAAECFECAVAAQLWFNPTPLRILAIRSKSNGTFCGGCYGLNSRSDKLEIGRVQQVFEALIPNCEDPWWGPHNRRLWSRVLWVTRKGMGERRRWWENWV
jgi:hypothetical protein